jgi:hypothetical protein
MISARRAAAALKTPDGMQIQRGILCPMTTRHHRIPASQFANVRAWHLTLFEAYLDLGLARTIPTRRFVPLSSTKSGGDGRGEEAL